MKINARKFDLALARQCKSASDLRGFLSPTTLTKIRNNPDYVLTTRTVGKIAKALNVDVEDIIEKED